MSEGKDEAKEARDAAGVEAAKQLDDLFAGATVEQQQGVMAVLDWVVANKAAGNRRLVKALKALKKETG